MSNSGIELDSAQIVQLFGTMLWQVWSTRPENDGVIISRLSAEPSAGFMSALKASYHQRLGRGLLARASIRRRSAWWGWAGKGDDRLVLPARALCLSLEGSLLAYRNLNSSRMKILRSAASSGASVSAEISNARGAETIDEVASGFGQVDEASPAIVPDGAGLPPSPAPSIDRSHP